MKASELRQLSDEDLQKKIGECEEEMFNLRVKSAFSPLDKSHKVSTSKKMIALCKTILNERKKGAAK